MAGDLALKHRELMAQGQHFGAKSGLGPAPDDQDFQHEANNDVEEGVEYERGVSHRPRVPGWAPARSSGPPAGRQSLQVAFTLESYGRMSRSSWNFGAAQPLVRYRVGQGTGWC